MLPYLAGKFVIPARLARVPVTIPSPRACGLNNGDLHTALNDAHADRVAGQAGGVVDVQLLHEMVAVFFDCLDADAKSSRDLLVGLAFGNPLEHFRLARTQAAALPLQLPRARRRFLFAVIKPFGNLRAEKRASGVDLPNCPGQNAGGGLFDQIAHRAHRNHLLNVGIIAVR